MADWANGSDLASMSRGGNLLEQMGYDPDEVRMNPDQRAALMTKLGSSMQQPAVQMAQNNPPPLPNPRSQNGNSIAPAAPGAPRLYNRQEPSLPPPATLPTPQSMATGTTSASVSPTGTPTPGNATDIQNARTAAGNLLAPGPAAPDTSTEDAMIAAKSVPLNPRAPMYRESKLGKVGRGFKAAAIGLGMRGVPGAVAGASDPADVGEKPYGAPNSDYDIDDRTRMAQLGLAEKQKSDALAKFKQMTDLRKQADTGAKDAGDMANTTAKLPNETTTANADMLRAQDAGNPKNEMEAIAAYGRETDPEKKKALWDTVTKMHDAQMSEKPPKLPQDHPSAALVEYSDRKAAMIRENNGKPLSSAQLASLAGPTTKGAPTKAGFEGLLKERDRDYQTQQKNYEVARKAAADDPQALAAVDADNNNKLNDLQTGWNNRLADYDPEGTLSHAGSAPASVAPATAPKPPRVGEVRKGYRYTGGDPASPSSWKKTGK